MNTQHTPTPWRVGRRDTTVVCDTPVPEIVGSDDNEYYGGHLIGESIAPDNAAFIVRACNAYDELVAALRDVVDTCDSGDYYGAPSAGAMQLARDALAKVGAL